LARICAAEIAEEKNLKQKGLPFWQNKNKNKTRQVAQHVNDNKGEDKMGIF